MPSILIDETGNRYGKLTVIKRMSSKGKRAAWLCKCDCGNEVIKRGDHLRDGQKSCGRLCELQKGKAAFNRMLIVVKHHAKKRGLEFKLTEEQVKKLNKSACFYCGLPSSNKVREYDNHGKHRCNGVYEYNGIDRIDNNKGYVMDNCVPCCKVCNRAKNAMSMDDFLVWIQRLKSYKKGGL
jgi:5-methylcytosine-specific restriction endonuclease McrA